MDATALAGNLNVQSVTSAANGIITITYKPAVVPTATNRLTINPVQANGTTALNLSTAAAGQQINWKCGGTGTTLESKYRPANCR